MSVRMMRVDDEFHKLVKKKAADEDLTIEKFTAVVKDFVIDPFKRQKR